MTNKLVGVLGGVGPLATVYFMDMVVAMTDSKRDQDHVDMIVSNKVTTPDRTAFITGKSDEDPSEVMLSEAKKLEAYGANFLVLTCNTAHYFFKKIQSGINIKLLNMVEETAKQVKVDGHKKVGILATTGNISTGLYQKACENIGLDYFVPGDKEQDMLMSIIYDNVKAGVAVDMDKFNHIINHVKDHGCDSVILGCTELSIIKKDYKLPDDFYIDSSEVIAKLTIIESGRKLKKDA